MVVPPCHLQEPRRCGAAIPRAMRAAGQGHEFVKLTDSSAKSYRFYLSLSQSKSKSMSATPDARLLIKPRKWRIPAHCT